MKKSINAWSVEDTTDFPNMFMQIKQAGFDGIELNVDKAGHSAHSLTLDITDDMLKEIKNLSDEYNLPVVSISTSLYGHLIGSPNDKEREQAKEIMKCQLRCAKALSAGGILVVPGGINEQGSYIKAYDACKKTFSEMKTTIMDYKINVGVENVWNGFFLSPFDMQRFIDDIGCEYVGAYFDAGNMIAFSWSEYWVEVLGKRIKNIHVKDFKTNGYINTGGTFIGLMDGDVHWEKVMPAIRETGFDGYLTAEVFLADMKDENMTYEEFYKILCSKINELIKL